MISTAPNIFSLIPFILFFICTICVVNLYLGFKRNKKEPFGRVTNGLTIYLLVNALFVWIVECFFFECPWANRMFPFIFLYGPFYYFFLRVLGGGNLTKKRILFHAIPFLVFVSIFVVYAYNGWYSDSLKYEYFMKYKVNLSWISLVGYCLYGFFSNVKFVGRLIEKRGIVLFWILLLIITMFYIAASTSGGSIFDNVQSVYLFRVTIYGIMLVVVLLLFIYQTLPLLNQNVPDELAISLNPLSDNQAMQKYEKSILSESQLDAYEAILNELMNSKELFLNQKLSLTELALETKIPAHHLTQVLNIRLNITFHNYINHLRVLYACELMNAPSGMKMSLEELGSLSGFNSKVSFNRHFKHWTRCTPSEYRKGLY